MKFKFNNSKPIYSKVNNNTNKPRLINSDDLFNPITVNSSNVTTDKIPKYVFQTWKEKDISKDMRQTILQLRNQHKDYDFYLYDDKMCRDFIIQHFDDDVLNAFDTLIPGAFKADLWRYCVLYIYGGVYMDIKLQFINGFNLNILIDNECYPMDIPQRQHGVWQGFLICKPQNEILKKCIYRICSHVKDKFYGNSYLYVTGPHLMYNIIKQTNKDFNIYESSVKLIRNKRLYLYYKSFPMIQYYNSYSKDKSIMGPCYSTLWEKRQIYKL